LTVKGKQNHYNIKYLKGYGSQISVKNQRIILKNGVDVFSEEQEIEEFVPIGIPYSRMYWVRMVILQIKLFIFW
jgi:CRISPR-associated protein Cas1